MKQLFIVLVALNLGYLLLQALSATPTDAAPHTESAADSAMASAMASASEVAGPEPMVVPSVAQPAVSPADPAQVPPVAISDSPASQAATKPVPPDDPAAESGQMVASCVIAGPFRRRTDGEALIKQLANAGIDGELERRDTRILPDYMVYVGPESSVAKARSLEATFRARNMDSHLIADGELRNALSLGVFSRGPLARSLQTQLRSEGYKAQIAELTRNRRGYQVQTHLPQLIRARLLEADTPMIDCPEALATASR